MIIKKIKVSIKSQKGFVKSGNIIASIYAKRNALFLQAQNNLDNEKFFCL
jgi:hypothetical protein